MAGCGDVPVGIVAEQHLSGMEIISELGAFPIIDQHNADVVSDMPVADRVHVVEKREVSDETETESVGVGQRSPYQSRYPAVYPETADIGVRDDRFRASGTCSTNVAY